MATRGFIGSFTGACAVFVCVAVLTACHSGSGAAAPVLPAADTTAAGGAVSKADGDKLMENAKATAIRDISFFMEVPVKVVVKFGFSSESAKDSIT